MGRAFRPGLPRGWHAVLPIILPAGEVPCWCKWRACLVVALRDGGLALLLDRACAGLWTLFLEAGALCQSELQVEGAMTIYQSLLRSREGWRLRHGPAAAEVAFSLTHSLTTPLLATPTYLRPTGRAWCRSLWPKFGGGWHVSNKMATSIWSGGCRVEDDA